jgi:mannose-1-phosphate guanylyltransferase
VTVPALVLAAGRSTRIEAVSGGRPKPLLRVGGRSLLEWNLRWLSQAGFGPLWINLHHRGPEVRAEVEAVAAGEPPLDVHFSPEDPILGTAGGWRRVAGAWAGTGAVVYGDNLTRFDLAAFLAAHRSSGAPATIALFDPDRHANTGIAGSRVLVSADGRVAGFEEIRGGRPAGALVSAGVYLLEPPVASRVPPGFADFGADVFPALVAEGSLRGHVMEEGGFCLGLDTPEHFETGRSMVERGTVALT